MDVSGPMSQNNRLCTTIVVNIKSIAKILHIYKVKNYLYLNYKI
jgi:hypothetical protein